MSANKLKIFNDPIYGFITIPNELVFNLIEHPYFQRLRRISQMGLSYLVYPGAHHTRFHHALGSMHLMQKAIQTLKIKGVEISEDESNALLCAILLHDIGHGPFSHTLEHSIAKGLSHEQISLKFMQALNAEFNGSLTTAIAIFKGEYHRKFLCQLVSGQLDMDRADYLKRDSFYTGVAEGNINSERLISMLNVVDDRLVIEEKGIYSVEKFLLARRLMYWQVYLHKTSLLAEQLLMNILKRVKWLDKNKVKIDAGKALMYFIKNDVSLDAFNQVALKQFAELDDYDVIYAIKQWQFHEDKVLRMLCEMVINRKLLTIKIKSKPIAPSKLEAHLTNFATTHQMTKEEAAYFIFDGSISNQAYTLKKEQILIQFKSGKLQDIVKASDHFNLKALTKPVVKYYISYPKNSI
jgi:HD superfamily phosphohydrolase